MEIGWGALWLGSRKWLKTGSLITAVLVALYGGVIRPSHAFRGFAMQRTAALAAIERNRHWVVPLPESVDDATVAAGVVGGVPGGVGFRQATTMADFLTSDRKLARTSSIDLLVKRPAQSADRIRVLTESVGGFLVRSQTNDGQDATNASLTSAFRPHALQK